MLQNIPNDKAMNFPREFFVLFKIVNNIFRLSTAFIFIFCKSTILIYEENRVFFLSNVFFLIFQ